MEHKTMNLSLAFNDVIFTRTYLNNLGGVLYRLHRIGTDKNYIGTAKDMIDRLYSDWNGYVTIIKGKITGKYRKIHKAIIEYGIDNFEIIIEKTGDYYTEIEPLEEYYVMLYDSYRNGYNDTPTGKSNNKTGVRYDIKGKIAVHNPNTGQERFINPSELSEYQSIGFIKGHKSRPKNTTGGMTWANNGVINIMVKVNSELPNGFTLGKIQVQKEEVRFMNNGISQLRVPLSKVDEFLSNGYSLGRLNNPGNKGKTTVHKGTVTKYIDKSEVDKYLTDGYELGGAKRSRKKNSN